MTKRELDTKTSEAIEETRLALQTVYDALNQGQQNKILKNSAVAALFERFGVET